MKIKLHKIGFSAIFFFIFLVANAQSTFVPLGRDEYQWVDHISIRMNKFPEEFNTFNKAYDRKMVCDFVSGIDTSENPSSKVYNQNMQYIFDDNFEYAGEKAQNSSYYPILKSIYKYTTDFYAFKDDNFLMKLNPVIFYQGGHSNVGNEYKYINTRGLEIRGNIFNKIGFYTYLGENQMKAAYYVQEHISNYNAVPGQGYYKDFKTTGVDFFDARGYFTFSAAKYLHFTFGQDKLFLGDGIRSLYLSDGGNASPFLRMNFHYKQFDYENLFMQLTKQWNIQKGDQYVYPKFAAMHHLSYNFTDNFQVGLFESVIFARNTGFEIAYLNPIIFYRQVEQSLGSPDNANIGIDGKWNMFHHLQLYGQFFLDDFNFQEFKSNKKYYGEKYALQAGLKYADMFGIKNLDGQVEVNFIRPFVYSHSDSTGNYTNYNQPLAHPQGANLKEVVGKIYYQPSQRFTFTAYVSMTNKGEDTASVYGKPTSWGGNPLMTSLNRPYRNDPSFPFYTGIGVETKVLSSDFVLSYRFAHNMYIDFNFIYRKVNSAFTAYSRDEKFFGIGIRINAQRPKFLF